MRQLLFALLSLVLLGGLSIRGPSAMAQTPAATIEDDNGNVVLRSNADGGLAAPAQNTASGNIPITAPDTVMMWYPGKAAFRAGVADGTEWDDASIGTWSVAFGRNTIANNIYTAAFGFSTTASGQQAFASGSGTTASGDNTLAVGSNTTASGNASTALGTSSEASGYAATALGNTTVAATPYSLAIGEWNSSNQTDDQTLFVVGNGSSGSRSDAFRVTEIGDAVAGGHTTFSDRRLKTDIEPLSDGILAKLDKLQSVRYEFKNQDSRPSGEQIGLIAQDVQKEFPELVSGQDDGFLSLTYPKFTAVLLKGLQEQQTQIDRQQATIDSLKQRVEKIESVQTRLARLEAQVQDRSALAGVLGGGASTFGFGLLLGGLLGAGLLWRRRT